MSTGLESKTQGRGTNIRKKESEIKVGVTRTIKVRDISKGGNFRVVRGKVEENREDI